MANPTEDRINIDLYEDDLPADTLPGFRPTRFEAQAKGEKKLYKQVKTLWRKVALQLWDILQLPGSYVTQDAAEEVFAWGNNEQARFDKLMNEFLQALYGNTSTADGFALPANAYTPVENSLQSGEPILPEHMRLMYTAGVERAMPILGKEAAIIGGTRNEQAIQNMLRIAFDRLSDGARLKLGDVLTSDTVPGGSIRQLLNDAMARGDNPLVVARELRNKFANIEGYNWARLARTETAFAQVAGMREEYEASGYRLTPGVSLPPWHPNCVCGASISVEDKRIILDVAATACEICQGHLMNERLILAGVSNAPDGSIPEA